MNRWVTGLAALALFVLLGWTVTTRMWGGAEGDGTEMVHSFPWRTELLKMGVFLAVAVVVGIAYAGYARWRRRKDRAEDDG